jgi:hypothetical protein
MKKDFVPFLTAASDGSQPKTSSQTTVVGANTAMAFQGLSRTSAHLLTAPNVHADPTVTFERDGDRVTLIKIQCPCGNVFELACDYAEGPQA